MVPTGNYLLSFHPQRGSDSNSGCAARGSGAQKVRKPQGGSSGRRRGSKARSGVAPAVKGAGDIDTAKSYLFRVGRELTH